MSGWKRMLAGGALCAATALTPVASAFAADKPADDAGARVIADFLSAYLGKAALPTIKITPSGSSYLVSVDLASVTQALNGAGMAYDPVTLQFKVAQQDDGGWRVEADKFPPITGNVTPPAGQPGGKINVRVETTNLSQSALIDPKLNWIAWMRGGADKVSLTERGPGVEEFVEFGGLKFDGATKSGASGLMTTMNETLKSLNFVMDADPKGVDPKTGRPRKPVHVSAQGSGGAVDIGLADFQPAPLLDAWRFAAAHPTRADYARDFDALKPVLTALAADHLTVSESLKLDKLDVLTEVGPVAIEGAEIGVGVVNNGAATGVSEHFAAHAIKLPDGLVPAIYAPVIPTSFDIGFNAHGFDFEGAVQEWLADAKLSGDGPPISEPDRAKVSAKFARSRPVVIDIQPSRIEGPSLKLAFQGQVTIDQSKPVGAITITLRDFDKTAQAVQGLGQEAEQKLTPVIAMAKGLGKPGADGALVWVCSIGADHVMKVNGLPLGKAPF
jgi:hypothetical protein